MCVSSSVTRVSAGSGQRGGGLGEAAIVPPGDNYGSGWVGGWRRESDPRSFRSVSWSPEMSRSQRSRDLKAGSSWLLLTQHSLISRPRKVRRFDPDGPKPPRASPLFHICVMNKGVSGAEASRQRLRSPAEPHALPPLQILYRGAPAGAARSKPGADKAQITAGLSPQEAEDIQGSARRRWPPVTGVKAESQLTW